MKSFCRLIKQSQLANIAALQNEQFDRHVSGTATVSLLFRKIDQQNIAQQIKKARFTFPRGLNLDSKGAFLAQIFVFQFAGDRCSLSSLNFHLTQRELTSVSLVHPASPNTCRTSTMIC